MSWIMLEADGDLHSILCSHQGLSHILQTRCLRRRVDISKRPNLGYGDEDSAEPDRDAEAHTKELQPTMGYSSEVDALAEDVSILTFIA